MSHMKKDLTMKALRSKVIKDCLTGINGEDYDPARVIGYGVIVLGSLVFIILSIYDTFKNGKFDYTGYATGIGGIGVSLTAAAAGIWLKKDTEPPHQPVVQEPPQPPGESQ